MPGGRAEAAVSPTSRGGGRTLDFSYPHNALIVPGTVGMGTTWINRQAYGTYVMGSEAGIGAPPAGSGWTTYKGRVCYKQTGSTGPQTGGFYQTGAGPFAIYFPTLRQGSSTYNEDFRCWRVAAIIAVDAVTASADSGLEIGPNVQHDFLSGTPAGFRVGPSGTSTALARVSARQTAGLAITIDQTFATVGGIAIDVTDWHCYEMRFIGATSSRDGVFKALIDGNVVLSANWGAGTLLNTDFTGGGQVGYRITVGNRGIVGSTYLAMCGLTVAAAATEAALL